MSQNTNLLAQASHALHANDRPTARLLLSQTLRDNPVNSEAWLLLSEAVERPAERRDCLERVLLLDPQHQQARLRLAALNQAPSPPAAPAAAPSLAPAASFGPPRQPHPAHLPPAYANPAVSPLGAQQYVAAPARRKRPLWIDIPLALLVLAFAGTIIASGLKGRRPTGAPNPAGAQISAAPTQSAQERATRFLNGLYGGMNDPRFYDEDQMGELMEPLAEEYFAPGASRSGLLLGLKLGMAQLDMPEEDIEAMTSLVDQLRLKGAKYKASKQTDTTVTLELTGGELEMLVSGGEKVSTPILETGMSMELEMELIDGAWYVAMISCGCETAK